ncbi:MAG: NADPH-dependent FMN reductase [Solirubrobacteraceae bacterium]
MTPPLIVGLGGSTRPGSSSEQILRGCLATAEALGARTAILASESLHLPLYEPEHADHGDGAARIADLVDVVRRADGLILASPGYHGGISGMVKNALDYVEDLRDDARPYLDGRAVGCVAAASGWQAANTTLAALRSVVHALRGWPTPIGVAINVATLQWDPSGLVSDPQLRLQLDLQVRQVVEFADRWARSATSAVLPAQPG